MGQKLGGWLVIGGCLLMAAGLVLLASSFGESSDESFRVGGLLAISFGALFASGGFYLKSSMQKGGSAPADQPKPTRGGCELCGAASPVIHCRVHQLHLCGDCLGKHYDPRSCAYAPSSRRPAPAKARAAASR